MSDSNGSARPARRAASKVFREQLASPVAQEKSTEAGATAAGGSTITRRTAVLKKSTPIETTNQASAPQDRAEPKNLRNIKPNEAFIDDNGEWDEEALANGFPILLSFPNVTLTAEEMQRMPVAFAYIPNNNAHKKLALERQKAFGRSGGRVSVSSEETAGTKVLRGGKQIVNAKSRRPGSRTEQGSELESLTPTVPTRGRQASNAPTTPASRKPPAAKHTTSSPKTPGSVKRARTATSEVDPSSFPFADEPELEGLQWRKQLVKRSGGATKGTVDRYWYTPKNNYRLRSMLQVRTLLGELERNGGDEDAAIIAIKGKR